MNETSGADKLQDARSEAIDLLLAILRDADAPAQTRVEAARVVLSHGDLDVRLARLEKSLREETERGKWALPG